ncbi:MAG: AsmA family protein [Proteobacteria bacterium]|nr:AsmA family protein [Pseudomonadota bacterium]
MPKIIKIVAIAVAAVLALLAAGIGILVTTFNPNDYKSLIVRTVQEKKQRTLAIPGDIKLTFFPRIGADLGRVTLSEHQGSAEFLSVDKAQVSLALLPLLKKQLVVDKVIVDGLHANIRRNKDGSTNFDDLLSKGASSGEQLKFDIDSVDISNAGVRLDDQQAKRTISVEKLNLKSGKIANGVPSNMALNAEIKSSNPALDAKVALKSDFTIDLDKQHFILKNMDAGIQGRLLDITDAVLRLSGNADLKPADKRFALDGVRFSGNGKHAAQAVEFTINVPRLAITDDKVSGDKFDGVFDLTEGARKIDLHIAAPGFEGSPQAFRIPSITLDAAVKEAALDAKATISGAFSGDIDKLLFTSPQLKLALSGKQGATAIDGKLTTPLTANFKNQVIDLSAIDAVFALPNPGGGSLKLNAAGNVRADLGKQNVAAALKGKLDESSFDAKFGLTTFAKPAYNFDIDIDRIDADRYQGKPAEGKSAAGGEASTAQASAPIDLSALQGLRANGTLKVGALKAVNLKLANVRADIRAADGVVSVSPLTAGLYGGSASGALSAGGGKAPHFSVRQTLSGINVGPLLKDAIGKEPIEGRGNVSLDIKTAGATIVQIKKALAGNAKLELRDGALHGVNIAQTIRNAKAKLGELRGNPAPQNGTAGAAEKTDFSEMSASFQVADGVAHNEDLNMKSPLLRVGGKGDIDIGNDRLDYLVQATIVSNLQGQGGPELQAMKGLTIPVRLSGPFSAIGYSVDFQGLIKGLAQQKIDEKKDEIKAKAREQIQDKLKGLFGK